MDIGKAFSYQFEDKQWITKLGIGALISLVPILNVALSGYMVAIIRNVAANEGEPLPDWGDLGNKFREGLILAAASLIYAAPLFILICLPLSAFVLSGAVSQNGNLQDLGRSIAAAGGVLFTCLLCVFLLYLLLLSIIHPAIFVIFSCEGTFASCFRLGQIVSLIRDNPADFFTTWLVTIVGSFAVGLALGFMNLVVAWIPCLGWMVGVVTGLGAGLYLLTADAHLYGQFRISALGRPAAPLPAIPAS
ncbi:MAG: DUF4013 domain-containing protein [Anaerolineales bacterium]